MKVTQNSSLPEKTPEIQKLAAKIVHYAMYISLAAIAGTGLIIGFLYWMGFKSGFLINSVVELHSLSVSAIYWFIAIHILAAIYHRLLKDGVWTSMVPFWTEKNK
jgi:cytochrome b561